MNPSKHFKKLDIQDANDPLLKQLNSKKALIRANALESLAKKNHPKIVSQLIDALSDSNPVVRWTAALYLGELNKTEAIDHLIDKLSDHFSEVRMRVVEALGILLQGGRRCPLVLVEKLKDPDELVRIETADSLGTIGDRMALPGLWRAIHDRSPLVRSYVAGAIGELGSRKDIQKLERNLRKEKSSMAKIGYYESLYFLGQHNVLPLAINLLKSRNYRVRCATAHALSDVFLDRSNYELILQAYKKALLNETTVAASEAIKSGIQEIKTQFSTQMMSK